jgi:hypothetical protein
MEWANSEKMNQTEARGSIRKETPSHKSDFSSICTIRVHEYRDWPFQLRFNYNRDWILAMTEALPLIQTKLFRPHLQADLIPRPRLFDALNAHWKTRPLTLISAPAGYGKSVLASMWLESCDSPSGWVSFDKTDNDLRTFVS